MREIYCINLPWKSIDAAERFIIVALIEQLYLIGVTPTCQYNVVILLTELACVQEARSIRYFKSIPVQCLVELAFTCLPLLQLVSLFP